MSNDLAKPSRQLPNSEADQPDSDFDRELVKTIAMDIGKEVVAYADQIPDHLEARRKFRRQWTKAWRDLRKNKAHLGREP